jgi:hypothetical protein
MMPFLRNWVALAACVALVACTTLKPVVEAPAAGRSAAVPSLVQVVAVDDRVRITRQDGSKVEGRVAAVSEAGVEVRNWLGRTRVAAEDVRQIEKAVPNRSLTVLAVIGGVLLVAALVAGVQSAGAIAALNARP